MKDIVEQVAKALVDRPDTVEAREVEGEQTTVYELRKVIGKSGRTAKALRTILSAAGMKPSKRYVLEILG